MNYAHKFHEIITRNLNEKLKSGTYSSNQLINYILFFGLRSLSATANYFLLILLRKYIHSAVHALVMRDFVISLYCFDWDIFTNTHLVFFFFTSTIADLTKLIKIIKSAKNQCFPVRLIGQYYKRLYEKNETLLGINVNTLTFYTRFTFSYCSIMFTNDGFLVAQSL